jgi:hypothetical protein
MRRLLRLALVALVAVVGSLLTVSAGAAAAPPASCRVVPVYTYDDASIPPSQCTNTLSVARRLRMIATPFRRPESGRPLVARRLGMRPRRGTTYTHPESLVSHDNSTTVQAVMTTPH